ncbi:thioredoxin family protein [Curvibacter sp. CHRR-16]|uniref:thioredoxin family protein n=1 Tax=Curvibacter sp. CHRR-16 TaxID=2835872 RepID=UPI001BD98AE3|nr:thioredoxin family protein [Curvibacter sp. CHRR-16]MBT0569858.1 thioredoxin family protein [Curvibacter sp. CHRR-16]
MQPFLRHLFATFLIAAAAIQASAAGLFDKNNPVAQTEQVRAELLAYAPNGLQPGQTIWLGVQLEHQPHWHSYWKNPGDTGLPTELRWTLPEGWDVGEIAWPVPQRIAVGDLVNLGYEGRVLLPVPVRIPTTWRAPLAGEVSIGLQAHWLVCRQECIPQDASMSLGVPVRGSVAMQAEDFVQAPTRAPQSAQALGWAGVQAHSQLETSADGRTTLLLQVQGLPAAWQGHALTALPEQAAIVATPLLPHAAQTVQTVDHNAAPATVGQQLWRSESANASRSTWQVRIPLAEMRLESPSMLDWVLVGPSSSSARSALRLSAPVQGQWPTQEQASAASGPSPTSSAPLALDVRQNLGGVDWIVLLGSALLGGLILNLMPCVLPVLAIKVLSLALPSAGMRSVPGWQRGTAYSVGVVGSMLALAAALLALRAGGEQLGWGFQLQNPWVVGALALLFTLLAVNLLGLWEWRSLAVLSGRSSQAEHASGASPHLQALLRHPWADAAWSGVLAVAVASPCTAPFMGVALGTALTLPAGAALAVFATLGLGLALPYLLLCLWPQAARWLPRPGRWMLHLRRVLALPLLATVLWLLWVLWQLLSPASVVAANTQGAWQAWTPEREAHALAAGQPVFVDYTAAWCITCQVNERTTLNQDSVQQAFAQRRVLLLRADWTRQDPAITQALRALGRSGVPVYVLHPGPGQAPVVLTELLTPGQVLQALDSVQP